MKAKFLFFLCCITGAAAFAQETNVWGVMSRYADVKAYAGKKFTIQSAVKVIPINKEAAAGMWVRVLKPNNKSGFVKNMSDNPITGKEWKLYSLSGKIDKGATYLYFGINYHEQGVFYFDDVRLLVENDAGTMDEIPLANGGFEEDSIQAKQSWYYNKQTTVYNISLTGEDFYSGRQSCKVDGTVLRSTDEYGHNDAAGKFADVNGIKIYYEEYGSGEPLLMLHGNSENINSFRLQIPGLSKQFHLYVVDTRGHGRSGDDGKTYTYDLFADDMNVLLDKLHLDSVNILGWSDGGNTGLIMAMKYPSKVKKLLTMGAVVFIDKTVVGRNVFKELYKQQKELATDTSNFAVGRLRRIALLLTEPKHRFNELAVIKCPVLVMAGEKDIVKEEHTRGIAAAIPGSTLMIIPKATHEFPWEDAKAFNKIAKEFFAPIP